MPRTSGPGETARKDADAGDRDPCFGAGDCALEVFGEASVSPEPSQGPLDHPASRFGLEGPDALAARDDLNRPFADISDSAAQLGATVDAVGEEVSQGGKRPADRLQQR